MTKTRKSRARVKIKPSVIQARAAKLAMRMVRAQYDSAQTNDDNRRHWSLADDLSPNDQADDWTRRVLRRRSRYEVRNNSYAKGMVLTLANDTIGPGPKLKVTWADGDSAMRLERAFETWARQTRFAMKLRTMRMARCQDGESFAVFTTNPKLTGRIKLDLKLVECDRIASPIAWFGSIARVPDELGNYPADEPKAVDGIVYDSDGNPVEYHILKDHPGEMTFIPEPEDMVRVPADQVIHCYRMDRPGQSRGVPEITPALPLYAMLRRYTLAVIAAAETAADLSLVLESDALADGEATELEPFDTVDIERRMAMTLPTGYKANQIKAEQPTTTYGDFKKEIINEIARCLNMPFNVAAGNSAGYNYSSGQLDHQIYFKAIDVDRFDTENDTLDRVFNAFMREAILIAGLVPPNLRNPETWEHKWVWPGRQPIDAVKAANAQDIRLKNRMTTYEEEKAKEGGDYYPMFVQQGRERDESEALGLPMPAATPAPGMTSPQEADDA